MHALGREHNGTLAFENRHGGQVCLDKREELVTEGGNSLVPFPVVQAHAKNCITANKI